MRPSPHHQPEETLSSFSSPSEGLPSLSGKTIPPVLRQTDHAVKRNADLPNHHMLHRIGRLQVAAREPKVLTPCLSHPWTRFPTEVSWFLFRSLPSLYPKVPRRRTLSILQPVERAWDNRFLTGQKTGQRLCRNWARGDLSLHDSAPYRRVGKTTTTCELHKTGIGGLEI